MNQPISGIMPPDVAEVPCKVVWPTIVPPCRPLGRATRRRALRDRRFRQPRKTIGLGHHPGQPGRVRLAVDALGLSPLRPDEPADRRSPRIDAARPALDPFTSSNGSTSKSCPANSGCTPATWSSDAAATRSSACRAFPAPKCFATYVSLRKVHCKPLGRNAAAGSRRSGRPSPSAAIYPPSPRVRIAAVLSRMMRGSTGRPSTRALRTSLPEMKTRLLVLVVVHQIDPADRLVIGGEADQQRVNLQIAAEVLEDLLGVEIAPDRLAVVVGGVGVLAADDDVGEAEVLPVNGVHDRLLRAAVEHLDVQPEQDDPVGHRLAPRAPQARVAVAVAQARGSGSAPRRCASARRRPRRRPWSRRSADSSRPRRCAPRAAASPTRRPRRTRGRGAAGCGSGTRRPAASPSRRAACGPRAASTRTCRIAGPSAAAALRSSRPADASCRRRPLSTMSPPG